ncbi:MAG: PilZ domain-containing protein [Deltaproteobacteria bacterium]|nr:PilZ domain-containing protein [Deltaproteobacteria bacterium]
MRTYRIRRLESWECYRPHRCTRRSPRYTTSLKVEIEGRELTRRGNVGSGGFFFEHDRELPPGSELPLRIRLPGPGEWLRVQGRVLGSVCSRGQAGVRGGFARLDPPEQRRLLDWIDSLQPSVDRAA